MALTVSMVGEDSTDGTARSVKMSDGGALHSSRRMTELFDKLTMTDGNAVTLSMLGAPLPCRLDIIPASGDTVQVWYENDTGFNSIGSFTATTAINLDSSVKSIKAQRTAGSGTTSKVEVW